MYFNYFHLWIIDYESYVEPKLFSKLSSSYIIDHFKLPLVYLAKNLAI